MFHPADFPVGDIPIMGSGPGNTLRVGGAVTPGTSFFGPPSFFNAHSFRPFLRSGSVSMSGDPVMQQNPMALWTDALNLSLAQQLKVTVKIE